MSDEEWNHVGLFMERIVQLEGEPIISTTDWEKHSYSTHKELPKPPDLEKMIRDSMETEREAIEFYTIYITRHSMLIRLRRRWL